MPHSPHLHHNSHHPAPCGRAPGAARQARAASLTRSHPSQGKDKWQEHRWIEAEFLGSPPRAHRCLRNPLVFFEVRPVAWRVRLLVCRLPGSVGHLTSPSVAFRSLQPPPESVRRLPTPPSRFETLRPPGGRQGRSAWSRGRLGCRERHVRVSGRAANGTFAAFNDPKVPFAAPHLPRKCLSRHQAHVPTHEHDFADPCSAPFPIPPPSPHSLHHPGSSSPSAPSGQTPSRSTQNRCAPTRPP